MLERQTAVKKPRVLLADVHKIVAAVWTQVLKPEFDLLGTVEDGRQLVAEAARLWPDVVVREIFLPLLNGIEEARQLRKIGVRSRIVFLSMETDAACVRLALEAGAQGYLSKHTDPSELGTQLCSTKFTRFLFPRRQNPMPKRIVQCGAPETLRALYSGLTEKRTGCPVNLVRVTSSSAAAASSCPDC